MKAVAAGLTLVSGKVPAHARARVSGAVQVGPSPHRAPRVFDLCFLNALG